MALGTTWTKQRLRRRSCSISRRTVPPPFSRSNHQGGESSHQTRLTIDGLGLFPGAVVKIDGRQAPILEETYKRLVVMAPARPQGSVGVVVTTPNGSSRSGRFTYGAGAWSPTGSFAGKTDFPPDPSHSESRSVAERYQHGAVFLDPPVCQAASPPTDYPCGKVLVVGGTDDNQRGYSHALAELYDPASGTWATTTPMAGGTRFDFTATLLADGKVLVAGGRQPDATLPNRSTAEVYDPRTSQWKATENKMSVGRQSHSATLLDDGRVLVAGGVTNETLRKGLTSADLYDPATNRWSPAAPMNEGRQLHTATLLPNGDVVVTGGFTETEVDVFVASASAEVFRVTTDAPDRPVGPVTPVTPDAPDGFWTSTGPMAAARFSHTATLLDKAPCGESCGKVLIAGGYVADGNVVGLASAEMFDPATATFVPAGLPNTARGGHSATLLDDGKVLLAGRAYPVTGGFFHPAVAHTELFDPVVGRWSHTDKMGAQRGQHTATLLDGPVCRSDNPPAYCHSVLVANGGGSGDGTLPGLDTAELYRPVPQVKALLPPAGSRLGGTEVAITGSGFEPTSTVTFGDTPAASVVFESTTLLRAVTPPHARGKVEVAITNASGTSGHIVPRLDVPFTYDTTAVPDQVTSLVATATSSSDITLTFAAPADDQQFPKDSPPAERYEIRQSQLPFTDADSFASARSLCPVGGCPFVPPQVGSTLSLEVHDLEPATTYYYAVAALNDIGQGPVSLPASDTTHPAPPLPLPSGCAAPPALEPGQITYPGSRYSLVGLPQDTQIPSDSPLYSWLDLGAGGNYSSGSAAASAGQGYWAWFKCPKVIDLAPGTANVTLPLGEYHASMVGNPSTRPATVTGHDFAARWDPALNDGAGGYRVSGYREPQPLDVGEGTWVFSYVRTAVHIGS
ncbi:MAG TPA: kelch repeat-containing protein [Acidimicrobiales bacterium]|nr:kelch repeat-containing protein [Acidimicrobiales bacterium]